MKVFVSWSGAQSHRVAVALKDWLPLVIQSLDPYVSSEDIKKGARWSGEVEKALLECRFGIICLTEDNLAAPWINFEAGALSKAIESAQTNVCPFLFNVRQSSVEGPLSQFQSVRNEKDDVFRLVSSINSTAKNEGERVRTEVLEQSFEAFWPRLDEQLKRIADSRPQVATPRRPPEDVLDEILEIVRAQRRLLMSKRELQAVAGTLQSQLDALAAGINPSYLHGLYTGQSSNAFADRMTATRNSSTENPVIPPDLVEADRPGVEEQLEDG